MRTPPPPRQFDNRPQFWVNLLNAIYYIWDRLNRDYFSVGDAVIYTGTGSPENNQVGSIGDLYLRRDGGTNTTLYVKESGTNTDTGWAAI